MMPKKDRNLPPNCINHPDQEMTILNEDDPGKSHGLPVGRMEKHEGEEVFQAEMISTIVNIYACPICGYCESYLIPTELDLLKKN